LITLPNFGSGGGSCLPLIVVVKLGERLHNSPGGVVGVDLKDNGIDIGTLQDGTYFVYHANPGVHALTASTDTASTQNFTLQAVSVCASAVSA